MLMDYSTKRLCNNVYLYIVDTYLTCMIGIKRAVPGSQNVQQQSVYITP